MGRRTRWTAALGAALLAAPAAAACAAPSPPVELTVASDLEDGFRSRLRARLAGLDLLLLAEPSRLTAGLACPLAVAGPVQPGGLLRQASRPLGYSPGSDVFRERTGFRLDGSLSGPHRQGLLLSPLPGPSGVFLWEAAGEGEPPRIGALASAALGGVRLEALALRSHPPGAGEAEEWVPSRPRFPGGALQHAGGRLLAGRALSGTLLLSGGERSGPGLLAQADLLLEGERPGLEGELELLGGACSRGYRTPAGDPPAAELQAGGRLAARLRRPAPGIEGLELEAAVDQALRRAPPALFPAAGPALEPCRTEWRLEGALRLRGAGLEAAVSEGGGSAAVRLEGAAWRAGLEVGGGGVRAEAEAGGLRLEIGTEAGRLEAALGFSAALRGGEGGRWWLEAGLREGRPRARLGWRSGS